MATSGSESHSGLVLELAEEFLERYRNGQRPPLREYTERHPELADEIREVFPAMAMMERIAIADESLEGDPTGDAPAGHGRLPEQLGDYRILREIGRGGMGVVYEAEQVSLGRHVALKVLPAQMVGDEKTRRRFEREAKAAAKLHHTNIVPVFGVGEDGDTPYYVMQFIRGQGLDAVVEELKRLRAGGERGAASGAPQSPAMQDFTAADMARSLLTGRHIPGNSAMAPAATEPAMPARGEDNSSGSRSASSLSLPGASPRGKSRRESYWQGIARIAHQAADALAYAHDQGILHRDIKPSNLLLDAAGTVWITDFGLAKASDQQDLTHTGDILGTLRYMPPEAFGGKVDARGDLYSLGLTIYELLAFRPAFDEKDRGRLVRQVTNESPPPLRKWNPDVPRDLETIVQKAIEPDPGHRYASAADLAEDLRRFVADEPIRARRLSQAERLVRWGRRNPLIAGLAAAVGALLWAGIAVLWHADRAAEAALERETRLTRRASERASEAEQARAASEAARIASEKARAASEAARIASEKARDEAQAARLALADELYASHMNLVQSAFLAGNVARAMALLDLERPRPGEPDRRGFEWHYWRRQIHPERHAWWRPAASKVFNSGEAFSGDGRLLARAETSDRGDELLLVVREVESGHVRHRLRLDYDGPINRARVELRFSGDDARILAAWLGAEAPAVQIHLGVWDLARGQKLFRRTAGLPTKPQLPIQVQLAPDSRGERVAWGLTVLSSAGNAYPSFERSRVLVDDVGTGIRRLDRTTPERQCHLGLALTAGGERLALTVAHQTGRDMTYLGATRLVVLDLPGGQERSSLDLGPSYVRSLALDPSGRRAAFTRMAGGRGDVFGVQVYDLESGDPVWSRASEVGAVISRLEFAPDGAWLLAAGTLGFQVLDTRARRAPLLEVRHPIDIQLLGDHSARFTRGGRQILGIVDGVIKGWDVPDPDSPLSGREYPGAATIAASPAGDLVARTGPAMEGQGPAILIQDAAGGRIVRRIEHQPPEGLIVPALFFSADGSKVGLLQKSQGRNGSIVTREFLDVGVWEARTGRPLARFDRDALTRGEPDGLFWIGSASISGDGSRLAIALTGYGSNAGNGAVLAGETLATNQRSRVGKIVVVDVANGTIGRTIRDDGRNALNLARAPIFGADGRFLIAATATDSIPAVCLWDLRQDGPPRVLRMPGSALPEFLAVTRDGKRLLGARRTQRNWAIDAWDLSRPEAPPRQVPWLGADVDGLTLSPDGTRAAILSGRQFRGGEVTLWDGNSFRELATWSTGPALPFDAVFTPDGGRLLVSTRPALVTGRSDELNQGPAVRVFDAEPIDPRLEAFALIRRLGSEEPLNSKVIRSIRDLKVFDVSAIRAAAERVASERPEDPDALLRKFNMAPRLPVPLPRDRGEPWLEYTAEAARVAPGMPLVQTEHGRALYALGRYAEAREAYAKAIALDPRPAEPHAWLALCEARRSRRAESLAAAAQFFRNSRVGTDRADVEALRDALMSGIREAFGPEALEDLGRLTNPIMPNGPDAFAR